MLSIIAREEEPKDEDEKNRIVLENSKNLKNKKKLEEKILELLQTTEGSKILDNEKLI